MIDVEDCPRIMCRHCKYWRCDADRNASLCKRLDHKRIQFYRPWFASYDCGANHLICADFEPSNPSHAMYKDWEGFEDYWRAFKIAWLTKSISRDGAPLTVDGNREVTYYVPLQVFLYGPLVTGGKLQATKKDYQVRDKVDRGIQLYKTVYEAIDGVKIEEEKESGSEMQSAR